MDRLVLLIGKISGFVPFDPANFPSVLKFFSLFQGIFNLARVLLVK